MPITRNPLAFPAGVTPGFNPNHIGARKCRWSGVPFGVNYCNVLNGKVGTMGGGAVGSLVSFKHGLLGPAIKASGYFYQAYTAFETYTIVQNEDFTFAGFFQLDVGDGGDCAIVSNNGGNNNNYGAAITINGDRFKLYFIGSIYAGPSATVLCPVGGSYFFIASWTAAYNGVSMLTVNLATGQQRTEFMGTGGFNMLGGAGGASGLCFGGNMPPGSIGHMMWSRSYLMWQEMQAWAQDPWSFWYPDV